MKDGNKTKRASSPLMREMTVEFGHANYGSGSNNNSNANQQRHKKSGGVSKSMLKQSRLNFDKIEKCE